MINHVPSAWPAFPQTSFNTNVDVLVHPILKGASGDSYGLVGRQPIEEAPADESAKAVPGLESIDGVSVTKSGYYERQIQW